MQKVKNLDIAKAALKEVKKWAFKQNGLVKNISLRMTICGKVNVHSGLGMLTRWKSLIGKRKCYSKNGVTYSGKLKIDILANQLDYIGDLIQINYHGMLKMDNLGIVGKWAESIKAEEEWLTPELRGADRRPAWMMGCASIFTTESDMEFNFGRVRITMSYELRGKVATLPKNEDYSGQDEWKLHRCADGGQCRASVGGGCASGWCMEFNVQPDEDGTPRYPSITRWRTTIFRKQHQLNLIPPIPDKQIDKSWTCEFKTEIGNLKINGWSRNWTRIWRSLQEMDYSQA